jgi:hypothetical protein
MLNSVSGIMNIRGEILRSQENSVPQTIVFRNKEIVWEASKKKLCSFLNIL